MKESDAQAAILDYLALRRHFCWRNNSGAFKTEHGSFVRAGMPGSPDIICCIDGDFVGLEVKGPKGDLSDAQKEFQRNIEKAGGRYHVVRSIDDVAETGVVESVLVRRVGGTRSRSCSSFSSKRKKER